jgi:hypothetical protein
LSPDAGGYGALVLAQNYLYLNRPVTMYGRSPASTTTAFAAPNSTALKQWVAENGKEVEPHNLDIEARAVAAYSLDGLLVLNRLLGPEAPPVDLGRWKARIADEIQRMPQAARQRQLDVVNAWMGRIGESPVSLPVRKAETAPGARWRRPSLSKVEFIATPTFLADAAAAVEAVEYLVGPGSLARRESWIAATARWAPLLARANLLRLRAGSKERAAA